MFDWLARRRRLLPYERTVLEELAAELSPRVRTLLRAQIAQIRYVQRLRGQPEVNFYARWRKGGGWQDHTLFPLRSEFILGRVRFRARRSLYQSTMWAVSGHIFALVTRPLARAADLTALQIENVEVGPADPMQSDQEINALEGRLPPSYVQYVAAGHNMELNGWSVMSPGEVYEVADIERDLVVLAVRAEGQMLLGGVDDGKEFYSSAYPGEALWQLQSTDFHAALSEKHGDG